MEDYKPINPRAHGAGTFFPEWLVANEDLSWAQKAVYARLAAFAKATGIAWCSQARLGRLTGLSERTVIRSLQELEDKGFLVVIRPQGQDRIKHFVNRYQFIWNPSMNLIVDEPDEGPDDDV
jgi:biotin operon repressor